MCRLLILQTNITDFVKQKLATLAICNKNKTSIIFKSFYSRDRFSLFPYFPAKFGPFPGNFRCISTPQKVTKYECQEVSEDGSTTTAGPTRGQNGKGKQVFSFGLGMFKWFDIFRRNSSGTPSSATSCGNGNARSKVSCRDTQVPGFHG